MSSRLTSHLATLCDCDICSRLALPSHSGVLDLVHNIHSIDDLAKDDVLVVQERGGDLEQALSKLIKLEVK